MGLEAVLIDLLLGVISNGLYSLLVSACDQDDIRKLSSLRSGFSKDKQLSETLQIAAATVAKAIVDETAQSDKLKIFLVSAETDAIVRQIFAHRLTSPGDTNLADIKHEFEIAFTRVVGREDKKTKEFAGRTYDQILKACEQALSLAISKGSLVAHEASSLIRHKVLLDELSSIKKRIEAFTKTDHNNYEAFIQFENRFRSQIADRHQFISPPQLDIARKLPIDKIYVPPTIVSHSTKQTDRPTQLRLEEFFRKLYRTVLLGNPGGGKSTISTRLCFDVSKKYESRLVGGRQLTPILIVLREYGAEKKSRPLSILQFIESKANSSYQVSPPPGAVEFLLTTGRAIVIFDGLDELLDTSYRQEITSDVESFCSLYPTAPVLVTSREVGYEEAPLDKERFEIYHLTDFDSEQVQEYVDKWFAADQDLTPNEQVRKCQGFMQESAVVSDLRANPLMLALMCSIYRGEGYIPRNRPDVYEKCALMLFDRWDKGRGIRVNLPFESHINPAMKFLAFWIYSNETLQNGVTERALIEKAAEYLLASRFDNHDEAESAAREFIQFCRGRAWVFTDVGTTKDGDHLYQFTHRTFLEYFAAGNIVRNNPATLNLLSLLLPRIKKGEWDVIAQLAFQLQNKNIEGGGDALLLETLNAVLSSTPQEARNLLSFCGRCLSFIVPRQQTVRSIVVACLDSLLISPIHPKLQENKRNRVRELKISLLAAIINPAFENRKTVSETVKEVLIKNIREKDNEVSVRAIEWANHLVYALHELSSFTHELYTFWADVSAQIANECSNEMKSVADKNLPIARDSIWRRLITINDFVKWHGVKGLFTPVRYSVFPDSWPGNTIAWIVNQVIFGPYNKNWIQNNGLRLPELQELGMIFEKNSPPFANRDAPLELILGQRWAHENDKIDPSSPYTIDKLTSHARFAIFIALAIEFELMPQRTLNEMNPSKSKNHVLIWAYDFLEGRISKGLQKKGFAKLQSSGLTEHQKSIVIKWTEQEIHFVEESKKKSNRTLASKP